MRPRRCCAMSASGKVKIAIGQKFALADAQKAHEALHVFLPFLVIDIVVASVTLSIGMVQLPPVMLSAPFKILLFVLVDGWNLLIGSLIKSFY